MSNCQNHLDQPAVAYCRFCGKPLCLTCQRFGQGTVFCEEHIPGPRTSDSPYTSPYQAPPGRGEVSPGLAFLLGLIPGVGAIYNAQYAKGLVHVVVFGMLISIVSSNTAGGLEPLFGILIPTWCVYMAFEAFHTAKKRQSGQTVDEFSSLMPMKGPQASRLPVGPMVLIGLGVLFLLNNLEVIRFYHLIRFWPVFLIALGAYMLYARLSNDGPAGSNSDNTAGIAPGVPHER